MTKELDLKNFHEGSIDDIVKYMKTYEGKDFKDRIKALEAFHDPDKHIRERIEYHADYVVNGHPSDSENMPGAYNLAHRKLDEIAKYDHDKITNKEDLDKVVDVLVDEMLKHAVGKERLDKAVAKLKKKGWDEKRIREFKERMFGLYFTDEEGRALNPYQLSKEFRGKKKIEIKGMLKGLSQQVQDSYSGFLRKQMTDHLVTQYDTLDIAPYVEGKFKKKGLEHEKDHLMLHPKVSAAHYGRLLSGDTELKKAGYKTLKKAV